MTYVFDQIRAMKPHRLRYVFIEAAGLRLPVDEDKRDTVRALYWHDWERLRLLFSRAIYQKKKRDFADAIRELREPMGAFLRSPRTVCETVSPTRAVAMC